MPLPKAFLQLSLTNTGMSLFFVNMTQEENFYASTRGHHRGLLADSKLVFTCAQWRAFAIGWRVGTLWACSDELCSHGLSRFHKS